MTRTIQAAVIAGIILLPNSSEAQTPSGPAAGATLGAPRGSSGVTIRQDAPQAPPSRPTPPPAGPLVPPAPPSALDSVDLFRAGPRTYAPRYDRAPRRNRFLGGYGAGYGYVADPFGYISQPYIPADDSDPRATDGTGYLRLDVQPETARVYVDGLYVGSVSDFRRAGRALDAGPHRVEIRSDGFESLSVDVSIRANDMLSYRGTLTPIAQRAEVRPATPKTFYVIPGCYAGDTRPRADQLPAGCRLSAVREVPPVKAPAPR